MMRQFYQDKVICIIGYHSILAKLALKKLLIEIQYPRKIYVLQIKPDDKKKEEFYNSNFFRLVDTHTKG